MKTVVYYASRTGNTRAVAEQVAEVLRGRGEATAVPIDDAPDRIEDDVDLVVVGGPTEGHGVTPPMRLFLKTIGSRGLAGLEVAAFDTRIGWPRLLSGSAAEGIAKRLVAAGARLIAAPESFVVSTKPALQPGELARAATWGARLADIAREGRLGPIGLAS